MRENGSAQQSDLISGKECAQVFGRRLYTGVVHYDKCDPLPYIVELSAAAAQTARGKVGAPQEYQTERNSRL